MDLRALSGGAIVLSSFVPVASPHQGGDAPPRYDQQLTATLDEPDATLRARARVEILYRAGDLPGALREALDGLAIAPSDRLLLRRALELETALRLPDRASIHAEQLAEALRGDSLDEEARRWWERESAALAEAVRRMNDHESSLKAATARARWISIFVLGAVIATGLALARTGSREGARAEGELP